MWRDFRSRRIHRRRAVSPAWQRKDIVDPCHYEEVAQLLVRSKTCADPGSSTIRLAIVSLRRPRGPRLVQFWEHMEKFRDWEPGFLMQVPNDVQYVEVRTTTLDLFRKVKVATSSTAALHNRTFETVDRALERHDYLSTWLLSYALSINL